MTDRLLIIGDTQPAPGKLPLQSATGVRLFRIGRRPDLANAIRAGRDIQGVQVVNLFDAYSELLRMRVRLTDLWDAIDFDYEPANVLILGDRVARKLGCQSHEHRLAWSQGDPTILFSTVSVSVVPHPSGKNRWWNVPAHMSAGVSFLSNAFKTIPNTEVASCPKSKKKNSPPSQPSSSAA